MAWTGQGSDPGVSEVFHTRNDQPWGPPSLLYNGYQVIPRGKGAGARHETFMTIIWHQG